MQAQNFRARRSQRLGAVLFALFVCGAASGACNAIAGIEDAELDDSLSGGSGGSSGSGGSGGSGGDEGSALCERYCETVQSSCPPTDETLAVYTNLDVCNGICSRLEDGDKDDRSGDTIHCRLFNAEFAATTEPDVHCPFAGPSGGDRCGGTCEVFCGLFAQICPEHFRDDCLLTCSDIPDLGGFSVSELSGNSIQCRFYHLSAASVDPGFHCQHAAGLDVCVE